MARWVDLPDWRDGTAALLHRALESAVWQTERITEIWHRIGMSPAQVVWQQSAAALWPTLTRDASEAGKLDALIRAVRAEVPAGARDGGDEEPPDLRRQLRQLCRAEPPGPRAPTGTCAPTGTARCWSVPAHAGLCSTAPSCGRAWCG